VDLRRLIAFARTWLPLALVAALLAGTAGFVVSSLQQKVYESKATLIVGQALSAVNPDYSQLLVAQNLAATYAAVAETRPILESVIEDLELEMTSQALADRVQVETPGDSTLLFISAQDPVAARAASIANAMAEQLIANSPTIQGREAEFQKSIDEDLRATQELIGSTQGRVDALIAIDERTPEQEAELQALEGRLASLRSTIATLLSFSSGNATNLLTVVEPAVAATSPVLPRTLANTLLAAVLGLLIIVGIALVVEQLDDTIKGPDVVEEIAGVSTLGSIGRMRGQRGRREMYQLAALLYPRSRVTEAYRALRASIEFASVDAPLRTLLVTSAAPGEGKTVTAANLAVVFAQSGRKVLLVDADLRKPGVHEMFGLPNDRGLTTLLRDPSVSLDSVAHVTEQGGLRILTTGPLPPNPAELLGSNRMQAVLAILKQGADLTVLDSPPLQAVADAAILSSTADGTLLVIVAGRSRRRVVRVARETLTRAGAKVLGAVLNRAPSPAHLDYAGYAGDPTRSLGAADRPLGLETTPTEAMRIEPDR
jgi:non-specific protein-tyrosine kinase